MAAMKAGRCLACVALWVAASGCIRSTFVLTDPRYGGRPHSQPGVYIDRLPPFPYISIGIIDVNAAAVFDLATVLAEAASKGSAVGCDVVVDRSIHLITPTCAAASPSDRREFICGLRLVDTPTPPAAPTPPIAPAPAH
jgi:hypothetical protein